MWKDLISDTSRAEWRKVYILVGELSELSSGKMLCMRFFRAQGVI